MTRQPIYLTWLNSKGGFDYFLFYAYHAHQIDVENVGSSIKNILPNWPNSYDNTADTIDRNTFRDTRKSLILRSQNLSLNQLNALGYIKSSVLVQIMYSRNDRRTVIVDNASLALYDEKQKTFEITFTLSFTDKIPSQRV